jgi:energy-coupling factor transporter ATP-binding protein EcfA2
MYGKNQNAIFVSNESLMRINKLVLKNFKRFTELTIQDIPSTSKLVLLIGSNGSGKSSVFDAFGLIDAGIKQDVALNDSFLSYFKKDKSRDTKIAIQHGKHEREFLIKNNILVPGDYSTFSFYGRTSFRQIPRLTRTSLGKQKFDFNKDTDRPKQLIDKDNRFENDVEKITEVILRDLFRLQRSGEEIRNKYIEPINSALNSIFGNQNGTRLELIEIIPPLEGKVAQITFKKGISEIHYDYLSAGEKEVVNLLFNLLSRSELYQDTIYYFDEIDLHLNTKIQFNLLKEITENWIPKESQLWTASHSLGFIEYAKQSELASIIDLDDLDFDQGQTLFPEPKDNPDVYEIAVSKELLPSLFESKRICFVENKDKNYFATCGIPNTVFVPTNNRNAVYHKTKSGEYEGIVDRDFLSDEDIALIRVHYPKLYILPFYSIENLLFHPDNLEEYFASQSIPFDKKKYIESIARAKNVEKEKVVPSLALMRTAYPYFGEPNWNGKAEQKRFRNKRENSDQAAVIANYLNSDTFEDFYKVFPMKTYATQIPERQHIAKSDLADTSWFHKQINAVIG